MGNFCSRSLFTRSALSHLLTEHWPPPLRQPSRPDSPRDSTLPPAGEFIHSARSHGAGVLNASAVCAAVLEMSGTSMATPLCAGHAALVRQYFRLGFYPAGAATPSAALDPSAALVKAVMIQR